MPGRSYKPASPTIVTPAPGGGSAASPVKVYEHTFNTPYNYPYTVAPPTISSYLTTTGWTNSQSAWSGSSGIIYLPGSSGSPSTITLTLNVQSGYALSITSFSALCKSQNNGYANWSMTINGITVGSGTVNVGNGASYSTIGGNVANAVNGLKGTVTVVITLSNAAGNGQFRMDNFILNGYVQQLTTGTSSATDYRYGFNGKEEDDEAKGDGNQQDYGMRIYDPRLGKFLSVDPLTKNYPMFTPYQFASNSPMQAVDVDGLEGVQYLETQTEKDGKTVIKRVVEADVYVAISQDKNSPNFYSKKQPDEVSKKQVLGDLKSQFPDNKFKDDAGNDVIWRFNVKTFEVDGSETGLDTKINELRNDPKFKVTPEGGGAYQYRGFIYRRDLINPEVIPSEPGDEGTKEEGYQDRGFVVTINSQFYDERVQRPHTTGHETTHFFLRLHPDNKIKNPANTAEGHAAAGGGILNYGTTQFRFPGQIRTSPDEKTTVSFEGLKPLSQTNVTNILQSVPQRPEQPKQ